MIVRELLTRLGFSTDEAAVKKYDNAMGSLTKTLAGVTAAAGAAGAAMFGLTKAEANTADQSQKLARQVGLTASELEALRFAEEQTGADGFASSLQNISSRLAEAARGTGRAKTALEAYGISATNADGSARSLSDILPEIADTMAQMTESQAGDLARQLGMTPQSILLMREGSAGIQQLTARFEELGGGIAAADGQAMEKFNDTVGEGMVVIRSIRRAVAVSFLPVMQELVETVRDWFIANRHIVQQRMQRAIEVISGALRVFWGALSRTIKLVDGVAQALGGWDQVAKLVGLSVVAFIGVKSVQALMLMTTAIKALSVAMWANPIGLIVAGAVALLVVIGAIIEDVYQWIKGNDSLFGSLFGSFDAFAAKAKEIWAGVKADFIDPLLQAFGGIRTALVGALTLDWSMIKDGFASIGNGMRAWAGNIGTTIRDLILGALPNWMISALETAGGAISGASDAIKGGFGKLNPFSSSPDTDMAAAGTSGGGNITMSADVNINVPEGTSQEQAIAIDRQVRDSMARQLRSAQQQIVVAE